MSTQDTLVIHRSSMILKGIGVVTFGLIAICYPGEEIQALMFPFGVLVTINGSSVIFKNMKYFAGPQHRRQALFRKGWAELLIGLAAIGAAAISAPIFWELIALWTILTGSVHAADFYRLRDQMPHWPVMVAAGIASVLFGLFVALNLAFGMVSLTYEAALFALLLGSSMIYAYFKLSEMRQYVGHRPGRVYSSKTVGA